jgi:hypothetical protein
MSNLEGHNHRGKENLRAGAVLPERALNKFLVLLSCCIISSKPSYVQAQDNTDTIRTGIAVTAEPVRVGIISFDGSSARIRTDLALNAFQVSFLDFFFTTAIRTSTFANMHLYVQGTASIEGDSLFNSKLSLHRAAAFRDFLVGKYNLSFAHPIKISGIGENWEQLERRLEHISDDLFPWRNEVLQIIRNTPSYNHREQAIRRLDKGQAYYRLKRDFFPSLRNVIISVESHEETHEIMPLLTGRLDTLHPVRLTGFVATPKAAPLTIPRPSVLTPLENSPPVSPRVFRPRVVLKSDLLALSGITTELAYRAPLPNIEVEYLFNPRWSVAFAWTYKPYAWSRAFELWEATAYTLEARWRFLPLHYYGGLYLGLYGRAGDYDQRPHPSPSAGNLTGHYGETGLSLGYTLPLSQRWVLEAGISAGYRHLVRIGYTREADHYNYFDSSDHTSGTHLTGLFVRLGYRF